MATLKRVRNIMDVMVEQIDILKQLNFFPRSTPIPLHPMHLSRPSRV